MFCKNLIVICALAAAEQSGWEHPALYEYVKDLPEVTAMAPKSLRVSPYGQKGVIQPREHHNKDQCDFALDVMILQDTTDSFGDNIAAMRDVQVDLIVNGIRAKHPESRFGLLSFRDKPVYPLGNDGDYCTKVETTLDLDVSNMKTAFSGLTASGGADAPENQLGAVYTAVAGKRAGSSLVGWRTDPNVVKLVVVSTDAGPHYQGDNHTNDMGFTPFSGNVDSETDEALDQQCLREYYPSLPQFKSLIASHSVYLAALVYDGDWANGWPSKSWITLNRYLNQTDDFVAPQAPDSSDFWTRLASVIDAIEAAECPGTASTTTPPPTTTTAPPPTTVATTAALTTTASTASSAPVTTAGNTETTTASTTTTTTMATAPTTPPVSPPAGCTCPCDGCGCCPEVVIKLQHKPLALHLDVENAPADAI